METLNRQATIQEEMERQFTNFKKDGKDRKTVEYMKKRIEALDQYWIEFRKNHDVLLNVLASEHDYFIANNLERTRDFYYKARTEYQTTLAELEKASARAQQGGTGNIGEAKHEQGAGTHLGTTGNQQPSTSTHNPNLPQGNNTKIDEMLRKQSSNFRAFLRTLESIDVEELKEKWEYEDALTSVKARWKIVDNLHWELDSQLMGSNTEYEETFTQYERKYNDIKKAINSKENQGLYFDKVSNMNLIKDEWKIVVFYEMKPYWQGTEALIAYTTSLEQICSHIHEQCNSILLQLRHGVTELEYYNQLFLTNQFREREPRQRVRRGLINAIGNIADDLFGVLDERFAQQYKRDISLIQANQKHITSLWKNQTSLIEAENNLLKRAEIAMNQQHKILNQHLVALEKATNTLKEDVQRNMVLNNFAIGAIIASNMMNNLRTMQNTLLDTITDIYHGRISLHLLTPAQISDELSTISSQLSKDVALPIDNVHSDLSKIYDLLTVKTRMLEDYVMFEIRLPLISRDKFEIFKVVPIPKYQDGNMITLVLVSDYISINIRKDSYISMTENDIKQCLVLSTTYYCHSRKPEYQMKEGDNLCQMGTSGCKTIIEPCSNHWIESYAINTYLYFCCNVCNVRTICTEDMKAHQLKGAGLINIGQGCLLRTDKLTIYPYKVHSSEIKISPDLYAPTIAPINDVINITLPQWSDGNKSYLDQDTEQIGNRIHTLMQEEQVLAEADDVSYHDIHHYVMIYIIIGIIAITGVIFVIRRVHCRWQVPQVAVEADSSTTPPLPSMRRLATIRRQDQSERIEMQAS
ncbi:hypothetical protein HF086_002679 [Spodoptera exigua]|uniref:Uncharacterized protein n=1 Tax=Spodoptera exigua TaxID=7107 RepID=A0A922SPA9_SPOEX|nr:hypothetical protein HF086_002679 [Spodoptera exigua]